MTSDSVWQIARYLLIAAGSFATGKGWVTSDQVTSIIGAFGALFTIAWGICVKFRHPRDHCGCCCANRRSGHQRRDRRGRVSSF